MTVNCVTGKFSLSVKTKINTNLNLTKDYCDNINDKEVITRENTNTDLNLIKDDFNKSQMCSLLSADLEGVKLDAVITESKLTNDIRSNGEGINKNKEMIKQIGLGKTNTLNTIETKLSNIESKISATPDAVCENAKIIKLHEDLLTERSSRVKSNLTVPQGSKIGPTAFIIKINNLPSVIREEMSQIMATNSEACAVVENDVIMFMDDSTLYEVLMSPLIHLVCR